MRQTSLALMLIPLFALSASAQRVEMSKLFKSLPPEVVPLFSEETKDDLLATYEAKIEGSLSLNEVRNLLKGNSSITTMSDDYMAIKLDDQTTLQIKVLPKGWRGYITSLVWTSEEAPKQSVLLFYDQHWSQLRSEDYFSLPALDLFLDDPSRLSLNETKQVFGEIGALAYSYQWLPKERVMSVRITNFDPPLYSKLYPEAKRWIKPEGIEYVWKKGQLKRK